MIDILNNSLRLLVIFYTLSISACSTPSPELTVRLFVQEEIKNTNPDRALDYICSSDTSGIAVLPKIPRGVILITEEKYAAKKMDENSAIINVYLEAKSTSDYGSARVTIVGDVTVLRRNNKWCIDGNSVITGLAQSAFDIVSQFFR
jgi:hypothetical protein